MADATINPAGTAPGNPGQPSPGPTSGLAAKVAAQRGGGPVPGAVKPAAVASGGKNKGGRASAEEEVSRYLAARGLVAVPSQAPGVAVAPAPVQPLYVVTPEFVGEVTDTFLKGVEAFAVRQKVLKVKALCGDMALAKEYGESSTAPPGCIETTAKAMTEVAKKYPAMLQWAPEVTIAMCLGMWGKKEMSNLARLDDLEARIAKRMKEQSDPKTTEPEAVIKTP